MIYKKPVNKDNEREVKMFELMKKELAIYKAVFMKWYYTEEVDYSFRGLGKTEFIFRLTKTINEIGLKDNETIIMVSGTPLNYRNEMIYYISDVLSDAFQYKCVDRIFVDEITTSQLELLKRKFPIGRIYGFVRVEKEREETLYEKTVRKLKENCKEREYHIDGNEITLFCQSSQNQVKNLQGDGIVLFTDVVKFKKDAQNFLVKHLVDFKYSDENHLDMYYPKEKLLWSWINNNVSVLSFNFEYTPLLISE